MTLLVLNVYEVLQETLAPKVEYIEIHAATQSEIFSAKAKQLGTPS